MWARISKIALATTLALGTATTVVAGQAKVDRIHDFGSVLAVAMPEDFPIRVADAGGLLAPHPGRAAGWIRD